LCKSNGKIVPSEPRDEASVSLPKVTPNAARIQMVAKPMPMTPDQIKIGHCYRMTSRNRQRVIVLVQSFGQNQARFTEDARGPASNSFTLKTTLVRFLAKGRQWSKMVRQPAANVTA
jgi:hypothetical protein